MSNLIPRLIKAAEHCQRLSGDGQIVDVTLAPSGLMIQAKVFRPGKPPSICNRIVPWEQIDMAVINILPGEIDIALSAAQK
jgi:hypothetical protein